MGDLGAIVLTKQMPDSGCDPQRLKTSSLGPLPTTQTMLKLGVDGSKGVFSLLRKSSIVRF